MSSCTTARFTFAKRGWIAGSSSWEEIFNSYGGNHVPNTDPENKIQVKLHRV